MQPRIFCIKTAVNPGLEQLQTCRAGSSRPADTCLFDHQVANNFHTVGINAVLEIRAVDVQIAADVSAVERDSLGERVANQPDSGVIVRSGSRKPALYI